MKAATYIATLLLGLMVGWALWHPHSAHIETAAPAIKLASGAQIIARDPSVSVPTATLTAVNQVSGAKLERAISITIQPKPVKPPVLLQSSTSIPNSCISNQSACLCAPVHVELGLLRMPDQTQRVVASSPDGDILSAIDIPVDQPALQRQLKWAAGIAYDPVRQRYGAFVDRDIGFLRLSAEMMRNDPLDRDPFQASVRIGIRF